MLKSDVCAATDVSARTTLPGPIACTDPPLNDDGLPLLFAAGVAVMVTVAVEPACRGGRVQLTLVLVEPPPQVPEVTLAVILLSGTPVTNGLTLSRTVMLLARSGPLFVTV
jgi:hypothetical protein